jgi:2-oxoglutarate dehydrogenase E2 component (dihydrolipoamide succinyltransferase)
MATIIDIVMPKLGESIMEATVLKWHKNIGDMVAMDETLLDIATDKVDSEVPSIAAGKLIEVLCKVDDVIPIGAVIARIDTMASADTNTTVVPTNANVATIVTNDVAPQAVATPSLPTVITEPVANATIENASVKNTIKFYSPLVLNIAQSEGISMAQLENIEGTGAEGRVSKKDILAYVANKANGISIDTVAVPTIAAVTPPTAVMQQEVVAEPKVTNTLAPPTEVIATGNVEIIAMDRMRKLIAKHMVDSKHTSPHVTSFTEADVTHLVKWREENKKSFEQNEGTKLTFTPLFIEAIVRCIKKFPLINSSLVGDNIIVKKDINIGMATALPSGNLIVPVIKNAEQLNLVGIAKQVNSLADNARNGKLKADDTQNGTFTLTNVGTFGSLMGTPIINQPQVAILAVGAIKKRPVVVETAEGDSIAIRHMMYLSLSYDHRVVDGSLGASFLTAVGKELEAFDLKRKL